MNTAVLEAASSPTLRARGVAALIVGFARVLTGLRALWREMPAVDDTAPTVYFANHASHADFVLLWASLPPAQRACTRPVAGADYWQGSALRRFIGGEVFRAVMIDRQGSQAGPQAVIDQMAAVLRAGESLIMFPEGTRNMGDELMLPLKSGLFHLARACPQVRLVPVWIDNLQRVLPKGRLVPVPLACTVNFGLPLVLGEVEDKAQFLTRAREAMLALRPDAALGDA